VRPPRYRGDVLLAALLAGAALAASPAAAAAPAVPVDGTYKGTMTDGQPVRIVVVDGRVDTAFATVRRYSCEQFGELGPMAVAVRANAAIVRRKFTFDAGRTPSYLTMHGTFSSRTKGRDKGTVTGKLRAYGTIATGTKCTSPTRGFTLRLVKPKR